MEIPLRAEGVPAEPAGSGFPGQRAADYQPDQGTIQRASPTVRGEGGLLRKRWADFDEGAAEHGFGL